MKIDYLSAEHTIPSSIFFGLKMSQAVEIDEANNYAETSTLENVDGIKLIKLASPQQGGKVLDLGCGTGYLSNV